jgi:hypothetical protein
MTLTELDKSENGCRGDCVRRSVRDAQEVLLGATAAATVAATVAAATTATVAAATTVAAAAETTSITHPDAIALIARRAAYGVDVLVRPARTNATLPRRIGTLPRTESLCG